MVVQGVFHLGRPDLQARGVDHAFEAVAHEEVTVFVDQRQIAGPEIALAMERDEGRGIGLRVAPVATHDLRAARDQLAHFALRQLLQGLGVNDARIHALCGHAQALALATRHGVGVQERRRLGQTVGLVVGQAKLIEQHFGHRLGHGRATTRQERQARQVTRLGAGLGKKVDHHGGRRGPDGHAVTLDQVHRTGRVPTRHHDDGAAQRERHVHAVLHAQHVEQRGHTQEHRVGMQAAPDLRGDVGRQHRAVGVAAALGVPGGARGVGQHGQVVRATARVLHRLGKSHGIGKGVQVGLVQRTGRKAHGFGQNREATVWHALAVGMHQRRLQAAARLPDQGLQLGQQILRHHGHLGAAVVGAVADLGQGAHGVDRHHRCAHAHDRIKSDDELRAVLAHEQHAVTAHHTQALLQVRGHRLDLRVELTVGEHPLGVDQGGLVGVTQRGRLHKMVERDLRHTQVVRHALGPVGVVGEQGLDGLGHAAHRLREISSFMTSLVPP